MSSVKVIVSKLSVAVVFKKDSVAELLQLQCWVGVALITPGPLQRCCAAALLRCCAAALLCCCEETFLFG
jgi:hypothetical protein